MQSLELRKSGPKYDRMFTLVDEKMNFVSQRTHPRLSLVTVLFAPEASPFSPYPSVLLINAPGMSMHFVEMLKRELMSDQDENLTRRIMIHGNVCPGIDTGDENANWFSKFLGQPVRLIQQVSRLPRKRTSSVLGLEIEVTFADGYPLLVATTASLHDLNTRIIAYEGDAVPMSRFRPNIVISGAQAYNEDVWNELVVQDAVLKGANKCVRCSITTVDQQTAEAGKEPLKMLAKYRRNKENGVEFGRNFIISEPGLISVGDTIKLKS